MNVEIRRKWETSRSIVSELFIDEKFICDGLEPSRKTPVHVGHPCIPVGTYKVIITQSPNLGYATPEVLNVPGRTHIRWHIGNKPEDVLGCVAIGIAGTQHDWVGSSTHTFHEVLMPILTAAIARGEQIMATYIDPS